MKGIHPLVGQFLIWACPGTKKKEGEGTIVAVNDNYVFVKDKDGFVESVMKEWMIKLGNDDGITLNK